MNIVKNAGATLFRIPFDRANCWGGNWGFCDAYVKAAWERGVTILPLLVWGRNGSTRFLLPEQFEEGNWGAWSRELVERYGVNGTFWSGKANPKPIMTWEIWNEPNLKANNPLLKNKEGKVEEKVQPENYGRFLNFTAGKIQEGSFAKTAHGTEVLFGGLYLPAQNYQAFLEKATPLAGPETFSGVSIHPYAFSPDHIGEMANSINNVRGILDHYISGTVGKPLWVTEIGWPVGGTNQPIVTESQQAELLKESFNWIKGAEGADSIRSVMWYDIRDLANQETWAAFCGLRKADGTYRPSYEAFQEESGAPPPEQFVAFDANSGDMWSFSSVYGASNTTSGMAGGTSPSVAYVPGTGYLMAFQGNDGYLWIYNPTAKSWFNTKLGMAAGTNPSIAASSDGTYRVAFQANTHEMWYYSSAAGTGINTTSGMAPGTSPSLTWAPTIGYVAAFQASDNHLWTYSLGNASWNNSTLTMSAGTSPSIASTSSTSYVVAIQAVDHNLWTYNSTGSYSNRNLGMATGTSPSVAVNNDYSGDGSYIAAFQANNHEMWYYSSAAGTGINTTSGMEAGTSPNADYLRFGGYTLAFQASNGTLWTFETIGSRWVNTGLGMSAPSSPSLVVY